MIHTKIVKRGRGLGMQCWGRKCCRWKSPLTAANNDCWEEWRICCGMIYNTKINLIIRKMEVAVSDGE